MKKFQKTIFNNFSINFFIFLIILVVLGLNALSINFTSSCEQHKYVLYECSRRGLCGGMVDRFKGIMNAYAWSLFTKRKLIVNITKPCNFINLMVPNLVKWNIDFAQLLKNGDLKANYTMHKIDKLDRFSYKSDLTNIDIINYKKSSDVISIFTNLEWISAFARNKYILSYIKNDINNNKLNI